MSDLFDSAYRIKGSYATKVKYLTDPIQPGRTHLKFQIFNRYVDVIECAAILGFRFNRKVVIPEPNDEDDTLIEIPVNTMINEADSLLFIYRMIMLNDNSCTVPDLEMYRGLSSEDASLRYRVDNAFRFDSDSPRVKSNMDLFNAYVRGGVDYLYDKFQNVKTREDAIEVMNQLLSLSEGTEDLDP